MFPPTIKIVGFHNAKFMVKKILQKITIKQWLQLGLMGCYLAGLAHYISAIDELDRIASGVGMNNTLLGLIFVTLIGGKKHD